MRSFIFSMLFVMICGTAQGGAWLPEKQTGKIIINQIEQTQQKPNIIHFRHRETYHSGLLEYGIGCNFAAVAKAGRQVRHEPNRRHEAHEARLGIMLNTPALATGLLPPFSYRLTKAALPFKTVRRDKRASLTLGVHNRLDETWSAFALADRIAVNRFRISQEVEFDRIRGPGRDWRNWLYRFALGYGALDVGTEAHHFIDYQGTYQALAHSYTIRWRPPQRAWQMRLKRGLRRAPMAGAVQKNDYLTLEMEWAF